MKIAIEICVVISSLILLAGVAQAAIEQPRESKQVLSHGESMFDSMDSNGDGEVTKSEFDEFSTRYFKKLDTNHDGKLTPDEMQGGHNQESGHGSAPHLNDRFDAADVNHDGGIDREEAKVMPMLLQYFDEMDADKDGKITRQEYMDAMPRLHRGKRIDSGGNQLTL